MFFKKKIAYANSYQPRNILADLGLPEIGSDFEKYMKRLEHMQSSEGGNLSSSSSSSSSSRPNSLSKRMRL